MRKIKVLGIAFVAVLAFGVVMASAANAANFTAESYPTALTGEQEGATNFFEAGGIKVECSTGNFTGTLSAATAVLPMTPSYSGCTTSLGTSATVDVNGCNYTFSIGTGSADTWAGTAALDCPAGSAIEVTTSICDIKMSPQTGINGITYTNKTEAKPKKDVTVDVASTNISGTWTSTSIFCPHSTGETFNNGKYTSSVTVRGYIDGQPHTEANQVGIDVG